MYKLYLFLPQILEYSTLIIDRDQLTLFVICLLVVLTIVVLEFYHDRNKFPKFWYIYIYIYIYIYKTVSFLSILLLIIYTILLCFNDLNHIKT